MMLKTKTDPIDEAALTHLSSLRHWLTSEKQSETLSFGLRGLTAAHFRESPRS